MMVSDEPVTACVRVSRSSSADAYSSAVVRPKLASCSPCIHSVSSARPPACASRSTAFWYSDPAPSCIQSP